MDRRQANELDNHITGHYGEDQFQDEPIYDGMVYLAAPYSDEDPAKKHFRYRVNLEVTADLIKMGNAVFSPIVHNHLLAKEFDLPTGFEFWEAYDTTILARAEYLVVLDLPGWKESTGVSYEIDWAEAISVPVSHLSPWGRTYDLAQKHL